MYMGGYNKYILRICGLGIRYYESCMMLHTAVCEAHQEYVPKRLSAVVVLHFRYVRLQI